MSYKDLKAFRNKRKANIIFAFGNKCYICGYNRCSMAFDLHHINSEEKEFTFGSSNVYNNIDKIISEAKKCVLVCSNCHREIHFGLHKEANLISEFCEAKFRDLYKIKEKTACLTCGRLHKNESYCSKKCLPNTKFTWDDEKLVSYHLNNVSNVSLAKHFGVSDVAVIKRLKKLGVYHKKAT